MAHLLGGKVEHATTSEYGKTQIFVDNKSKIYNGVSSETSCWMSHTDLITKAPTNFKITGYSSTPLNFLWMIFISVPLQTPQDNSFTRAS